ncbi:hypothetical protein KY495_20115 [Massilia sp. PAMC28688]|uniref:hypothetical protein n=1 Tax=Massilia sp. PAMC28688 TaxID=2861283 RepID=UPI001C63A3B0|nr:hypothetical protein [Massilia sp. PAMC28688]QYF92987.1 hypothetical protein KY495_20115 [Massilia sp. PAMC28688]
MTGSKCLLAQAHFQRAQGRTFITLGAPAAAAALRRRIAAEPGWACEVSDCLDEVQWAGHAAHAAPGH